MKKQLFAALTAAALALSLAACGSAGQSSGPASQAAPAGSASSAAAEAATAQDAASQTAGASSASGEEAAAPEEAPDSDDAGSGGRTLIVYFAVAENSAVDAVSSASVVVVDGEAKGLTRTVAEDIQAVTGGDLFSIQTAVEYPGDIDELIDYASNEQSENARPALTSHIENLDEYDTVFIGYPLWWYDLPQVMYSFFDEYDFAGKTIIPFDVHRGSRLSRTPDTIQALEPDATVVADGFAVSHETAAADVEGVAADVADWLHGLGY